MLSEIFKRLPTKSLCRFRCVCKEWNSIISSPFFRNLHHTFGLTSTPRNQKPYLQVTLNERYSGPYHPSDKCYALCNPNNDVKQQLYFPFRAEEDDGICKSFNFIDVIHGVVCFSYWSSSKEYIVAPPSFHSTVLWNPSVHKYVALPCVDLVDDHDPFDAMGFGYDAINDDFKVVMIGLVLARDPMIKVCSARQGVWRPPASETRLSRWFPARNDSTGCFVNGALHWAGVKFVHDDHHDVDDSMNYSLLMFDCTSEEGRTLDLPHDVANFDDFPHVTLFEYGGMLAAFVHRHAVGFVWVMEEHGDPSSWKKLYTVNRVAPGVRNSPYTVIRSDSAIEIEKTVPYGRSNDEWGERLGILRNHVYSHSMFLMDDPKAQSYTNKDTVPILTPQD